VRGHAGAAKRRRAARAGARLVGPAGRAGLPRRRRRDGRPDAPTRLVRLADRRPGDLAAIAALDCRGAAELQFADVCRLGWRARLPLQRRLQRYFRGQAPAGAREALPRRLAGDLARHRSIDRCRDGRRSDLPGKPAAHHPPEGVRRADLVHLLLFARTRRKRRGGRHVLRLRRNHAAGDRRAASARKRGQLPPRRRSFAADGLDGAARRPARPCRVPLERMDRHERVGRELGRRGPPGRPGAVRRGLDPGRVHGRTLRHRAPGALPGRLVPLDAFARLSPPRRDGRDRALVRHDRGHPLRAGRRGSPARKRGAVPQHGRPRAGDDVGHGPERLLHLPQPALVRVHRPGLGGGARPRLDEGDASRRPEARRRRVPVGQRRAGALPRRVPPAPGRTALTGGP
jgi:hypothetical protein